MTNQPRGIRAGIRRVFRLPIRRRDIAQADADEELESFFTERVEDLIRKGMSPKEARAEALRRLGGPLDEVRAALRRSSEQRETRLSFLDLLDDLRQDTRYVMRGLIRRPGFTATAILCLAIGIGANTTMFGVVDALLLRPPAAVRDPGSLFWVGAKRTTPFGGGFDEVSGVSYPDYLDFSRSSALTEAAAYTERVRSIGRGVDVQQVHALTVTHQFMPLLGVKPAAGRFFLPNEDLPGASPVVVLGYAFREHLFGHDVDPVGKTLRLGSTLHTIIGVAPRDFNGVGRTAIDLYVPLSSGFFDDAPLQKDFFAQRGGNWLTVIARGKSHASAERLWAEFQTLYQDAHPNDPFKTRILVASPTATAAMTIPRQAQNAAISLLLAGVAVIVLLIACANVASLLLTRAARRRREIAVRLALGVSRGRLSRLLIAEALILAGGGAIAALLLARAAEGVLRATLLADVALLPSVLDVRVLATTAGVAVLTAVLCGLAPLGVALHAAIGAALKSGERDGGEGRGRVLGVLLVAQVALTLVLLTGTGLFVRSMLNLKALDLGFDVEHLMRARVGGGFGTRAPESFYTDLLDRVRLLPGVQRASLATAGPFGNALMKPLQVPGHAREAGMPPTVAEVAPDFFATLGMTLERGRLFTRADDAGAPLVAVVNDAMAKHYWNGDAIGKCLKIGGDTMPCTTVVGIVGNTRQGNITQESIQNEHPAMAYYVPLTQTPQARPRFFGPMLYVRTRGAATALVPDVRRLMETLAPDLPYPDVIAFSTALEPQFRPWRLGATMFGLFGALAMVLAIVGLYGVLAFRVGQRTHEIGVRVALGAQRSDVHRLVLAQGLRLAFLGVGLGIVAALAGGRAMNALLYGVSGSDPLVLTITTATLLMVSLMASYLPARRATHIDPLEALREL